MGKEGSETHQGFSILFNSFSSPYSSLSIFYTFFSYPKKWLPNSMGIDPAHKICVPFYEKVKELGMVILVHTGEEKAVVGLDSHQKYGNPLLLKTALDVGAKVIMAHCASLGKNADIESTQNPQPKLPNFQLFLRMMANPKWEGILFGDISAITQFNRMDCVETLLKRTDLHHRLVNGSDYPLPMINMLILTRPFLKRGMISQAEKAALSEIYNYNPLLYDFVLKRTIRGPENQAFPASMFMKNKDLDLWSEWEPYKNSQKTSKLNRDISLSSPSPLPSVNIDECLLKRKDILSQISVLEKILVEKKKEAHELQQIISSQFGRRFGVEVEDEEQKEALDFSEGDLLQIEEDSQKDEFAVFPEDSKDSEKEEKEENDN